MTELNRLFNTWLPRLENAIGQVILAVLLWIVGRWLIGFAVRMLRTAMEQRKLDETLVRWVGSAINIVFTILLIVSLLGYFGLSTTGFAALFAGAGVAIGAAWAGLLSHFAAGVFLLIFRPFKVGDVIQAGGVSGTVREIGLFGTTLDDADNVRVTVGNNKIFNDNITNFTANPWRAVNARVEIDPELDQDRVMALLTSAAAQLPNILKQPPPSASIVDLRAGPVIAVRVACHPAHYGETLVALNRAVKIALSEHHIPAPTPTVKHV